MGAQGVIQVSPAVIELRDVEPGTAGRSAVVSIKNLDGKRSHSVCIRPPATKRFAVRGMPHTERLAPGMELNVEVLFDARQIVPSADHFDSILVRSDSGDVEVPLRALAPKPRLSLEGVGTRIGVAAAPVASLLDFGAVAAGACPVRTLRLVNGGTCAAHWKAVVDGVQGLRIQPENGHLEAGHATELVATLSAADPGAISGELLVTMALPSSGAGGGSNEGSSTSGELQWQKEPAVRCPVGASVVSCLCELRSEAGGGLKAIEFGTIYQGESTQQIIHLYNGCPTEARFDLSFGPASEMGPADGSGPTGEGNDDPHTTFLRLARIRAKARESKDSAIRVSPLASAVPPYGSLPLVVTFEPPIASRTKGFESRQPEADAEARLFDYVVQIDITGPGAASRPPLRFPVRGRGLLPRVRPEPRLLHFGSVACGDWADQLVTLSNDCSELPAEVQVDKGSPYCQVQPSSLTIPPGASSTVLVRYQPKAMGKHKAAVRFLVMPTGSACKERGGGEPDVVLAQETVEVVGSCLSIGKKAPLPGGPEAMPQTFSKERHYVDEQSTAIWTLKAEQRKLPGGYRRPKLWETCDNAQALDWIGPEDAYGVTKDVQVFRVQHADEYTAFIRSGRLAKARSHLTRKEGGDDDKDMGMHPYRGLSPPRLERPKGANPLWTVEPDHEGGPSVASKLPASAALATLPLFKERPEREQERAECSTGLTVAELSSIQVAPRVVDFGKVSTAHVAAAHFVVTNTLRRSVHVALDLSRVPELAGTSPLSQVVPASATARFPLTLRCHDMRAIRERCEYCINGAHFAPLEVAAEVVPVTLRLSATELDYSFGLDNWDSFVDQSLLMSNPHNFTVEYEWEASSPCFTVTPPSGSIKAKATAEAVVRWTPSVGLAAAAASKVSSGAAAASSAAGAKEAPAAGTVAGKQASLATVRSPAAPEKGSVKGGRTAAIAAEAAASNAEGGATAAGLVQSAVMTLRLKGGADVPQRVTLVGELPGGLLKSKEKEVSLGAVPVGEPQTTMIQIRNSGSGEAAFRAVPNAFLTVRPDRARCAPDSVTEVEVSMAVGVRGLWSAVLELEVRGGKSIKVPIRAEGVVPSVKAQDPSLAFPATFIGSVSRLPLELTNTTAVPATVTCDLTTLPEFELLLSRDSWAAAGYDSCPVQKIGANGEMSTLGSKRVSRRVSSVERGARGPGDAGYRFIIQLKPSSALAMSIAFRPSRPGQREFQLPLVLHAAQAAPLQPQQPQQQKPLPASGAAGEGGAADGGAAGGAEDPLAVRVVANGVQPQLVLSKNAVDFGACVVARGGVQQRLSPYVTEVYVRNNTEAEVEVLFGSPSTEKQSGCLGVFTIDPMGPFTLAPDEGAGVTLRFTPKDERQYEGSVPIFIHGGTSNPHLQLEVSGAGRFPRLKFDMPEVLLPPVPLGVRSWSTFNIVNDGYDNLELRFRLPADEGHLPLKLDIPEGNLIGLAREKLPVVVSFASARPVSFTALLEFLDESGCCFTLAVTGTSDNCMLTTQPFLEANIGQLPFQVPRCGPPALPPEGPDPYEMPWHDSLGPMRCSPGLARYLSAVTCKPWGPELRQALSASRSKLLLELVEVLGGKAVSTKAIKSSGNKTDAARQLVAVFEAVLLHLKVHGALVNAVKPELLLEAADFDRIVEARGAAAAGDPLQEEALEAWENTAAQFEELSARAWSTVVLQLFKIFVLARVTPQTLRSMPGMQKATEAAAALAAAAAQQAAAGSPPGTAASAKLRTVSATSRAATLKPVSAMSRARSPTGQAGAAAGSQQPPPLPELGPGDIPPDEVLTAGSNVYSTAEACLLCWLNVNLARVFPERSEGVANFDMDLRDGVALFACLLEAWPQFAPRKASVRVRPGESQEVRQNAELVVRCMQDLSLPYEVDPSDILEPGSQDMLLLVLFLFQALPQLTPKATVEFLCKLGESQVRDVELSNPGRKLISYGARLEGHPDFALEATNVRVEPGKTAQLSVRCAPSTSIPRDALLVLQSRRDGGAPAASLVFQLRSAVQTRRPLRKVEVSGTLYEMAQFEVHVVNPIPTDCDFSVSVVHAPPEDDNDAELQVAQQEAARGAQRGVKTAPSSASTKGASSGSNGSGSYGSKGGGQQPATGGTGQKPPVFADPFGIDRPRLRLRTGAGEKLRGFFLPFSLGTSRATLVLRDADCGEFCYELSGVATQPAPFMEHKAVVAHNAGAQFVDVLLPFTNSQLEGARRTYMEKHPLGRDKEQLARLRQDAGRQASAASALQPGQAPPGLPTALGTDPAAAVKPDQLLEYAVASSSGLVTVVTPSLALHSAVDAPRSDKQQHGGDHQQQGGQGQRAGGAAPAQGGRGGAGSGPGANTLRLSVKPTGTGLYPAVVTLTSPYDVRVLRVEVSAQVLGQSYSLEMDCPARQQVSQDVPLVNTGDAGLSVEATVVTNSAPGPAGANNGGGGDGRTEKVPQAFTGPRTVSVAPGGTAPYPLTFRPLAAGSYSGRLELFIPATGERNVYNLTGRAGEPLEEGHLLVECQARCPVQHRLQVPNLLGALPLAYTVLCDLDCLEGPATLQCTSARSMENYKFFINPPRSGTFMGTISFVAPDGNYAWFSVEVRATPPPESGALGVLCPVRRAVAISIPVSNPGEKPLVLRASYSSAALVGPAKAVIPAGAVDAAFECYFAPLVECECEGAVKLVGDEAGEHWWRIHMTATPGGSEELPLLASPLGKRAATSLTVTNPLGTECAFAASVMMAGAAGAAGSPAIPLSPCRFSVSPASFTLGPYASTVLQVEYTPCSLGVTERGSVAVSSDKAGSVAYGISGKGLMPGEGEEDEGPAEIFATLGKAATKALTWKNPLQSPATVQVSIDAGGEGGATFTIPIKGAHAPPPGPASVLEAAAGASPMASSRPVVVAAGESAVVSVPGGGTLQLPVSFCPTVLKEAPAQVSVKLLDPDIRAQAPLVWRYSVKGVAQADTSGVSFALKCKARQRVEEEVWLPLPGMPPGDLASGGDGSGGAPPYRLEVLVPDGAADPGGVDAATMARAAVLSSLSAELLEDWPVMADRQAAAPAGGGGGSASLQAAPRLRARLVFAPRRALEASAQVAVARLGGGRWSFDVSLSAVAPDVDGVLTLEAHMGHTAELPLMLYAPGDAPAEFEAAFTPESPLAFDVRQAKGVLPVAPRDGGRGEQTTGAPITVLYTCREMGRVLRGRLVVTTAGSQHVYDVRGRMPQYVPPDPRTMKSTLDTGLRAARLQQQGPRRRQQQQQQQHTQPPVRRQQR